MSYSYQKKHRDLTVDSAAFNSLTITGKQDELFGRVLNRGIGRGRLVKHQPVQQVVQIRTNDVVRERGRFLRAQQALQEAVATLFAVDELETEGEHRDILEAYRLLTRDQEWVDKILQIIARGYTAEAAVQKVQNQMQRVLEHLPDAHMREKMYDLQDLSNRLLDMLNEKDRASQTLPISENIILVAETMGPAELLDYDRRFLKGLILKEGSAISHVTIVARALDIPVIAAVQGFNYQNPADVPVILDGERGCLILNPSQEMVETYHQSQTSLPIQLTPGYSPITADGIPVEFYVNAGLPYDFEALGQMDMQGVGLYRTEISFMVRQSYPDILTQVELYRQAMEAVDPKPVLFRILDIGGDKNLPYMKSNFDHNPLMGWRAVRLMLDQPGLLRQQIRALILAAQGRPLHLMVPMITEVAEFDSVRHLIEIELQRAYQRHIPLPQPLKVGVVLEVPALIWQLPNLLRRVDFISVGTNDLFQFSFAADRGNHRVSERYDTLAPAFIKMLHFVVTQCQTTNTPLWLCGELASNPVDAIVMLALGVRKLSVSRAALPRLQALIPHVSLEPIQEFVQANLDASDHTLRGKVVELLQNMNIHGL